MIRLGIIQFSSINDTEALVFGYGFCPLRSTTYLYLLTISRFHFILYIYIVIFEFPLRASLKVSISEIERTIFLAHEKNLCLIFFFHRHYAQLHNKLMMKNWLGTFMGQMKWLLCIREGLQFPAVASLFILQVLDGVEKK